jgi:hypothetical protein
VQPVTLSRSITTGQPLVNPLLPHIQPQYLGAIVIAEAVGTSGSSVVTELSINDPYMSGCVMPLPLCAPGLSYIRCSYAIYEGSKLARAVFVNSLGYFTTDVGVRNRTSTHISFTGTGLSGKMTVKRLTIAHADDTQGLLYAGQSYETRDARPSGALNVTTSAISAGVDVQGMHSPVAS